MQLRRRRAPRPSLVASAAKLTPDNAQYQKRQEELWQYRALGFYDNVGEIRFCSQFYARMLSRVDFFPAKMRRRRETRTDQGRPRRRAARPDSGPRRRAQAHPVRLRPADVRHRRGRPARHRSERRTTRASGGGSSGAAKSRSTIRPGLHAPRLVRRADERSRHRLPNVDAAPDVVGSCRLAVARRARHRRRADPAHRRRSLHGRLARAEGAPRRPLGDCAGAPGGRARRGPRAQRVHAEVGRAHHRADSGPRLSLSADAALHGGRLRLHRPGALDRAAQHGDRLHGEGPTARGHRPPRPRPRPPARSPEGAVGREPLDGAASEVGYVADARQAARRSVCDGL